MKFLVDMNLSPRWVEFLKHAGFEAAHWSAVGAGDATDAELMRWAALNDYIVATNDLGFGAILAVTQRRKPSVVQIRADIPTPDVVGQVVLEAVRRSEPELRSGALLSVDAIRARLRILPLLS